MTVNAIVINYRTPGLSIEAVASLQEEMKSLAPFRTYLIDNASGDDSIAVLKQALERPGWRDSVVLVEAPRNGGFGYAINLAVRRALAAGDAPDYFYVLNPDALVEPGSLARVIAFLDHHPKAGLAGSHIRGTDGKSQVAAFHFPSLLGEIENAVSLGPLTWLLRDHVVSLPSPVSDCEVDWISGTSMLIRRSTFETIGFFDEEFFLYFEEIDFCRRAKTAGIQSWFVADAPITHIGAVSTGMMDQTRAMPPYWFDSRHRYFRKHHGLGYAAACDVARVLGMLVWRAKERVAGRPGHWRPNLLRDFLAASWKNLR